MYDLILCNANAITMDPILPAAETICIKGNRIESVVPHRLTGKARRAAARIIDCNRKTVLPGFVDAHCHIRGFAESLVSLNLSRDESVRSIRDSQKTIQKFSRQVPPGKWIRGNAFDEFSVIEQRLLNRHDLDEATQSHPVKITHRSGHAHMLNSMALSRIGITEETGDPPEGLIDRDPKTGQPTGILYGMGSYLAGKIAPLDGMRMGEGLRLANHKLLSFGITSLQDTSSTNDRDQWRRFESWKKGGVLQPRLTMILGWKSFAESQREFCRSDIDITDFRLGGVKIIADRVSGSLHPSQMKLNEAVSAIHEAGLQSVIHAVEQPVIEAACRAISWAMDLHPRNNHRHRIEHCSVCPPGLCRRLAQQGITVVTQPSFIYYSGDRYLETVPVDQQAYLYALGSMLGNGLSVGLSSDFPVVDPNPLVGICAAVTRMTQKANRISPQQKIAVKSALSGYTLGAAAAVFEDAIKGSITPGKLADLVVLNKDPNSVRPESIKDIEVTMTILNGRIVWEKDSSAFIE
jgi:predicted amidohydrolase YtcJ